MRRLCVSFLIMGTIALLVWRAFLGDVALESRGDDIRDQSEHKSTGDAPLPPESFKYNTLFQLSFKVKITMRYLIHSRFIKYYTRNKINLISVIIPTIRPFQTKKASDLVKGRIC